MEQNKFLKFFSVIAFLAFASVSCWATAESLHLLLPSWPVIMCWIVTIGFFFIASLGTKMIADSLNQNVYIEKRSLMLIGGILITIVFWLLCSMPTNTHTFFYRNVISDVVSSDITTTQGYLDQLKENTVIEAKIDTACIKVENEVTSKLAELQAEINNEFNPGNGPKTKQILAEFANILGVTKIEPLSSVGSTARDRQKIINSYRSKILSLLEVKKQNIRSQMSAPDEKVYRSRANTDWKNLNEIVKAQDSLDLNKAEVIYMINERLVKPYATIKTYSKYVKFNDYDEEIYTAENQVTKVKKMLSVFDVWKDFFAGRYAGHGFVFWVIISILVDLAAFIFFDLAFRKDGNSI